MPVVGWSQSQSLRIQFENDCMCSFRSVTEFLNAGLTVSVQAPKYAAVAGKDQSASCRIQETAWSADDIAAEAA